MRRLLSKYETAEIVGIHCVSLMRLVRQGQFPAPIKLSQSKNSRVRFLPDDVECWLRSRSAHNSINR